jgi:hypothetical protein
MRWMHLALAGLLVAGSAWLFFWDAAARPGQLSRVHRQAASCPDCHRPWRGVSDGQCLQCHGFGDVNRLRPAVRFHQEERLCLRCHREHAGGAQPAAAMDHTVLSGGLECSLCHLDPHGARFGADCRQCHGLASWSVPGYRHPPAEERQCHRCHPAPASHQGEHYREIILSFHLQNHPELRQAPARECWRCHVTHDWRHLKMAGYRAPEE